MEQVLKDDGLDALDPYYLLILFLLFLLFTTSAFFTRRVDARSVNTSMCAWILPSSSSHTWCHIDAGRRHHHVLLLSQQVARHAVVDRHLVGQLELEAALHHEAVVETHETFFLECV